MMGESEAKSANLLPDHIPQEIFINILARLPVKSLLQFRLVSKHCRSLISDPQFIQKHLDVANDPDNLNLRHHIVFQKYPSVQITSIGYRSLDLVNHSCKIMGSHSNSELLASCDGLLLVCVGDTDHFLWNPSIQKYKKIQGCDERPVFKNLIRLYGLGYDSSTDAYKVVSIICAIIDEDSYEVKTLIGVYNCKTQNWRQIGDFPYEIFTDGQGIVVNGAPHWVVSHNSQHIHWSETNDGSHVILTSDTRSREHVIIWFDLGEERFKEVANPSWLVQGCSFDFGSLKGQLSLAKHGENEVEIWVMRKYGVRESWTRVFSVPKVHIDNFVPLCRRSYHEVLVEDRKHKLITYNRSNGNVEEILRFHNPAHKIMFQSISYVESLVWPPGED